MKPQSIRLAPSPAQLAADRRRRAAATERADTALAGLLADLPHDAEFVAETLRALIRGATTKAAAIVGSPRAIGLLSGAAADVAPAHRPRKHFAAAEAVFSKGEG